MSIKLLDFNNLGNFQGIKILLLDALEAESRSLDDITKYTLDKSASLAYAIDGIIELLLFIGWIAENDDGELELLQSQAVSIESDFVLKELIVEALFRRLRDNDLLHRFIPLDSVKYDVVKSTITIRNYRIPLRFSGLRNLLIDFGVLTIHDLAKELLYVNTEFVKFFEKEVIDWIRRDEYKNVSIDSFSYDQFLRIQQLKERYGEQAEEFVLLFEQTRLKKHPKIEQVKIISKLDVGAGYDIVSFNSLQSEEIDRFVEVKSYSGKISFYWSQNEVQNAQIKRGRYYLYLVDRELIHNEEYEPLVIPDPFMGVFSNDNWDKIPQSWLVTA